MFKIKSLQYLRAIACMSVLFTHVLQVLNLKPFGNYFISGGYGVDMFFIISGFLIYITTKDNDSWRGFVIKRIFRIFPLYWVAFLLYLLFQFIQNDINFQTKFYVQNLLMLPWDGALTTKSLLVGVAWSTVYEVYFYAVFAALLICRIKKQHIILLLVLLLLLLKYLFIFNLFGLKDYGFFNFIYSVVGTTNIIPFVIGVIFGMLYKNPIIVTTISKKKVFFKLLFIISNLSFLIILLTEYNQYKSYLISSILFCAWLFVDSVFNIDYSSKVSEFFIRIGNASYSIYLLHCLIIIILIDLLQFENLLFILLASYSFTIAVSFITYKYIEKPFMDISKDYTSKLNS